jgi:hypothetical protein
VSQPRMKVCEGALVFVFNHLEGWHPPHSPYFALKTGAQKGEAIASIN